MKSSKPMEDYANKQLDKVLNFLENERSPVFVDLVLEPSKVHAHHRIELRVKTPRYDLVSNYEGPEFYEVLDRVVDIMYHELLEAKRKWIDDRKKPRPGKES